MDSKLSLTLDDFAAGAQNGHYHDITKLISFVEKRLITDHRTLPIRPNNLARFIICSKVVHSSSICSSLLLLISVAQRGMLECVSAIFVRDSIALAFCVSHRGLSRGPS
jgi:hypothetical protein